MHCTVQSFSPRNLCSEKKNLTLPIIPDLFASILGRPSMCSKPRGKSSVRHNLITDNYRARCPPTSDLARQTCAYVLGPPGEINITDNVQVHLELLARRATVASRRGERYESQSASSSRAHIIVEPITIEFAKSIDS